MSMIYPLLLLGLAVAQDGVAPSKLEAVPVIAEDWMVSADMPLSTTLNGWADRAGWKLVWESDADFKLAAGGTITGDFEVAAQQLLSSFRNTHPRLKAVIYRGNRVLRVWTERAEP